MKLYQIEYMMTTAECGSITKAADKLMVSRPAVSKAIRELEMEFDVEFFKRSAVGIELTEPGKIFFERAIKLRTLINETISDMHMAKQTENLDIDRIVSLGMSFTSRYYLIPIIAEFRKKYPDIYVAFSEFEIKSVDSLQKSSDYDFSVGLSFSPDPPDRGVLTLCNTEFKFCCSKDHPLANRKSVSVQDIKDEPLVEPARRTFANNQTSLMFAREGLNRKVAYRTESFTILQRFVSCGMACAVENDIAMKDQPDIVRIPFTRRESIPLKMMWNLEREHNSAFYIFLEFMKEYVAKQTAR